METHLKPWRLSSSQAALSRIRPCHRIGNKVPQRWVQWTLLLRYQPIKVKVTSLYMPQRASQRKLGKKPATSKGEASMISKRKRRNKGLVWRRKGEPNNRVCVFDNFPSCPECFSSCFQAVWNRIIAHERKDIGRRGGRTPQHLAKFTTAACIPACGHCCGWTTSRVLV